MTKHPEKNTVRVVEITREGFTPERLNRIFAGIGRLMTQLDASFPGEPNHRLLQKMVDSQHLGLIAALEEDDTVIGTLSICTVTEPAVERGQIGAVVVDEARRGEGIGDLLLETAKDWAVGNGLDVSLLQTETWRGLENFYGRHGTLLADTLTFAIPSGPEAATHA